MIWPLVTNCFATVLISTNTWAYNPPTIYQDQVFEEWIKIYATSNVELMDPQESAWYWCRELEVWDEYNMTLEEYHRSLTEYKLRFILDKIKDALKDLDKARRRGERVLKAMKELLHEKDATETTE